tara:strand:- start:845 stop:1249 length:405 start_codon:yes stop_codon:yes gene_type:complete
MGLDMYASRKAKIILVTSKKSNDKLNLSVGNTSVQEIAYWRKHNRLHGWMEELWRKKGNEGEFNTEELLLELIDIVNLEKAILKNELPMTEGFFFGGDSYEDYEEHYMTDDLKFVKEARQAINEGDDVIYNSWW